MTWNGKRVCIFESFLVMCPRSLVSFAFFRSLSLSLGFARVLSLYLVFSCRSKCFVLTFSCFLAFSVLCLFPFAFSSFLSLFPNIVNLCRVPSHSLVCFIVRFLCFRGDRPAAGRAGRRDDLTTNEIAHAHVLVHNLQRRSFDDEITVLLTPRVCHYYYYY